MEYLYLHQVGLVRSAALRYSDVVKPARPGIASTNRRRLGPFASLLDQILRDETALDGLAFAYSELGAPERRALVQAVLEDAADPSQALAALLAVEDEPRAQQRLAGLLSRQGRVEQIAFLEGNDADGEALLVQSLPGIDPELLRITWKQSHVCDIELESPRSRKIDGARTAVDIPQAVDILAPLLWTHIRSGGRLPEGAERFAGFFSRAESQA